MSTPIPIHDEPARLGLLVRQHALTAQLLGVDAVPRYRTESTGEAPVGDDALVPVLDRPTPVQARPAPIPPPIASPPPSPSLVPARSQPAEIAPAGGGTTRGEDTPRFSRPAREPGETERAYRARCLDALRARYESDAPHRQFVTAHSTIVFHDGDPCARLAFVGEAPGEEEDKTGIPFVGRAGQLLNKMIVAMGLTRESVYICNVLKTRPPGNATPTTREAQLCEPYLLEQLAIVAPEVIVTLGLPATKILLKTEESMARLRGKWSSLALPGGGTIPVIPTYHPAFLLRAYTDDNRAKVWADLQMALDKLGLKTPRTKLASGQNPQA
jgi:uracil-DNA glycosylase